MVSCSLCQGCESMGCPNDQPFPWVWERLRIHRWETACMSVIVSSTEYVYRMSHASNPSSCMIYLSPCLSLAYQRWKKWKRNINFKTSQAHGRMKFDPHSRRGKRTTCTSSISSDSSFKSAQWLLSSMKINDGDKFLVLRMMDPQQASRPVVPVWPWTALVACGRNIKPAKETSGGNVAPDKATAGASFSALSKRERECYY